MSRPRRARALLPLLAGLLLLAAGIVGVWLTWPREAPAPEPEGVRAERVGPRPRPLWAQRAPSLRPPTGQVAMPPESRVVEEPFEEDTGVEVEEESGPALITGFIVDSRGANVGGGRLVGYCRDAGASITAPPAQRPVARADEGGFFEMMVSAPSECEIIGMRRDGLLVAYSERVELFIEPGEELEIDVVVPATRTGGIGVQFRPHPDGMLVERVHEGTPAWRAGLQSGDVIVEVDGESAAEFGQQGFIERMTGPEGSEVSFRVRYEEDGETVEETKRVERQFLDRDLIR